MKNGKEVLPLLQAVWFLNFAKYENKDERMHEILEYAFRRVFGANTNLMVLAAVGREYEEVLADVNEYLKAETKIGEVQEK